MNYFLVIILVILVGSYVLDVIVDILKPGRPKRSRREFLKMQKGRLLVLELLSLGRKRRQEILIVTRKAGIGDSTVDNQVLPVLIAGGKIKRDAFGWYSLATDYTSSDPQQ